MAQPNEAQVPNEAQEFLDYLEKHAMGELGDVPVMNKPQWREWRKANPPPPPPRPNVPIPTGSPEGKASPTVQDLLR